MSQNLKKRAMTDATQDFDPETPRISTAPMPNTPACAQCPVAHTNGLGGFWALTRYEDVAWPLIMPHSPSRIRT
jgi:hypothetical protein